MTRNMQAVIDRILVHEGGEADVGDEKGVTKWGQTPQWLEDHGFVPPSNAADAATNYAAWLTKTRIGDVVDRDVTLGYVVADFAVHSGESRAIKALQKSLGGVDVDGEIGPQTLNAVAGTNPSWLAHRVMGERIRFVGQILRGNPSTRQWAAGWLNRLADLVESLA